MPETVVAPSEISRLVGAAIPSGQTSESYWPVFADLQVETSGGDPQPDGVRPLGNVIPVLVKMFNCKGAAQQNALQVMMRRPPDALGYGEMLSYGASHFILHDGDMGTGFEAWVYDWSPWDPGVVADRAGLLGGYAYLRPRGANPKWCAGWEAVLDVESPQGIGEGFVATGNFRAGLEVLTSTMAVDAGVRVPYCGRLPDGRAQILIETNALGGTVLAYDQDFHVWSGRKGKTVLWIGEEGFVQASEGIAGRSISTDRWPRLDEIHEGECLPWRNASEARIYTRIGGAPFWFEGHAGGTS
jgi:hypothetical protein